MSSNQEHQRVLPVLAVLMGLCRLRKNSRPGSLAACFLLPPALCVARSSAALLCPGSLASPAVEQSWTAQETFA